MRRLGHTKGHEVGKFIVHNFGGCLGCSVARTKACTAGRENQIDCGVTTAPRLEFGLNGSAVVGNNRRHDTYHPFAAAL